MDRILPFFWEHRWRIITTVPFCALFVSSVFRESTNALTAALVSLIVVPIVAAIAKASDDRDAGETLAAAVAVALGLVAILWFRVMAVVVTALYIILVLTCLNLKDLCYRFCYQLYREDDFSLSTASPLANWLYLLGMLGVIIAGFAAFQYTAVSGLYRHPISLDIRILLDPAELDTVIEGNKAVVFATLQSCLLGFIPTSLIVMALVNALGACCNRTRW